MTQRLKDLPAACEYLAISRAKVYQLISAGELKSLKIGRATRFDQTELDRFVDALTGKAA